MGVFLSNIGIERPPHTELRLAMASRTSAGDRVSTSTPTRQGRIMTVPRASAISIVMLVIVLTGLKFHCTEEANEDPSSFFGRREMEQRMSSDLKLAQSSDVS